MRQDVRPDPAAGVVDAEADPVATRLHGRAECHLTAPWRVAQCVGDEVRQNLAGPDRIDVQQRQVVVDPGLDGDARRLGRRPEGGCHLRGEDGDVGRLAVERQAAGFGQRERPQVVDEPRQHPRLVED